MTTPDADTMDDLIADCAHIPSSLSPRPAAVPIARTPNWTIDDTTAAQVADLDEYV